MRKEWLEDRISDLKKTKAGLALALGVSPARITDLVSGKRSVGATEIPIIAAYLEWPEILLLSKISGGVVAPTALGSVRVIGEVQAGIWRPAVIWPYDEQYIAPVAADPRYAQFPQFGLLVRGPSMNKIFPDGSVAICVNLIDLGRDPRSGQRVVVQRRIATEDGYEVTIKELEKDAQGDYWLWPRSTDPNFQQPWKLRHEYARDDNEDVQVAALVIGSYRPEP